MEIAPIPGIRALPAVSPREADTRVPAIFDIDASAKPGEDGRHANGRKAAGAEEDEEDDQMLDGDPNASEPSEEMTAKQVDYFA